MNKKLLDIIDNICNEAEIDAEINGFRTRPNRPMRAHGSIVKNQRARYYREMENKIIEAYRKETP